MRATAKPTFVCAACGRERPISKLSQESLDLGRTASPARAVAALDPDDLVCVNCTIDEDLGLAGEFGRTDLESFEFSGAYVSDGMRQFYHNNY